MTTSCLRTPAEVEREYILHALAGWGIERLAARYGRSASVALSDP